ncbi:MAG: hypothetical protein HQL83_04245 [Magnetococcales bacterium]|nr:hypothetical protein [Magnetococcales bacterium]MBF0346510.1 hypothetical protein [Magnetococcales bacterium]
MKRKKNGRVLSLVSLLCLSTLANGCGGGGDSGSASTAASPPAEVLVGKFLDGPTDGLNYRTSGNDSGATDAKGQFTYVSGESISFYLGGLPLGSTSARGVITPIDLVSGGYVDHDEVVNLSRFLQTLDEDGNPSNGITISAQARSAAQIHFPSGPDYSRFFKTDGHGQGFARDSQVAGESVATKGLENYFKDAGIFRYKKSNWVEQDSIAGFLVPERFATNHLRGTIQNQTENWSLTLTPTQSSSSNTPGTTTTTTSSAINAPGTAAFTVYYKTTETTTSTTENTFQYYDPDNHPLVDGTITFPGIGIVTQVTSPTTSTGTTGTTTGTAATTTRNVAVTGTLTVTFKGATVSMVSKIGSSGRNQGQINIELLESSTSNTATFTPDATTTESVTIPASEISSLVLKATVDQDQGTISDSKFSIKFANSTWQNSLNLGTVYGTWSRGSDSGNIIFNELYRSLAAGSTRKTWELYGIGYTDQEMTAELSGSVGAYTQLSNDRTNLKLITDSTIWSDKNNPISLQGYVGFELVVYDDSVRVDKLTVSNASGGYTPVTETNEHEFSNGNKRYFNLASSNMAESTDLKTVLSKDLSERTSGTTSTTTTTDTSSQDGTETWAIKDVTQGPGMVSVVFTKNSSLKGAGYAFQSTLAAQDYLIMKLAQ